MIAASDMLRFGPHLDVAVGTSAAAIPGVALENQDNYLLIDAHGRAAFLRDQQAQQQNIAGWSAGHVRLAVLDGMGGHGRGREAAEAVVAGLLAMAPCHSLAELSDRLDALHASLQRDFADPDDAARRPGTTLTLLELPPGEAPMLYHVGDSRLYEITTERAVPLTVDHVPATAFAMAGVLGEQEWWQQVHAEHRSQIAQAFILGNAFAQPSTLSDPLFELAPHNLPTWLGHLRDRRALTLRSDAVYLLATDGFWACAAPQRWIGRWPKLLAHGASASAITALLFDAMRTAPPPGLHLDNLTAIVLRPCGGDDTYA